MRLSHTKCCKKSKVFWYHVSEDRCILMCFYWRPHDKTDFVKLGEIL